MLPQATEAWTDGEGCVPALKSHRGVYEAKPRRKALQQGITCVRVGGVTAAGQREPATYPGPDTI